MVDLESAIDAVAAESDFSGAVRVDREGELAFAKAYGLAHRGYQIPNTVDIRFGVASGGKALTALAVVGLIERGLLDLTTTARSVLGDDLPLIDDAVTIEQLLAHRSGIGDYLDEDVHEDFSEYLLPVPVQNLAMTEQYLTVLDGFPMKFPPDERFSYCNGGYVVLSLIAERVSGEPYHDLVLRTVCEPAGMVATYFPRSDQPDGRSALGYLEVDGEWRTNLFHLPVRATGDGGVKTTVADISALWRALFAGEIVSTEWVETMVRPRSEIPEEQSQWYGLGFYVVGTADRIALVGEDAGESFWSSHNRSTTTTFTVMSNTADGVWPIGRRLRELLPS